MNTRKFILRETGYLALGEVLCVAAMAGIFAMLGYFDYTVLLGGLLGMLLAVGNFFMMALFSSAAADKAADQDIKAGKSIVKASYSMRLVIIGVLLLLFAKSGHCNLIALICPLLLVFPILTVVEFFRKTGDGKK